MVDQSQNDYVTADEACVLLVVKPATLYAYVSRGLLRSYKQGMRRQRLYRKSELNALLGVSEETTVDDTCELPDASSWVGER